MNSTRKPQPLILIRGYGGADVEDERKVAYQGFNDGTVYPRKRGENYIYEGFILRFLKSSWRYQDATNVVGYYSEPILDAPDIPEALNSLPKEFFHNDKIVVDPAMALYLIKNIDDPVRTLWIFRYYDLDDRSLIYYGKALARLIDFIRALTYLKNPGHGEAKVNIIAHSMGGLIARQAIQETYPKSNPRADDHINKIVTLGTPHQGISFQILQHWIGLQTADELKHFNPDFQKNQDEPTSYLNFKNHFPSERLLTIIGTNYKSYDIATSSLLNRFFPIRGELGLNYNRSDGLVKQTHAQLPDSPRTFIHKCHGGADSLVTSREAFEIATRFFFGNLKATLRLAKAKIHRGGDLFGKSEFFFGVSIKPRGVDFDLFHQSIEAENCYGPFSHVDLSDPTPAFGWAAPNRLIWEGWLNTEPILKDDSITRKDMVLRLDIYVGERDSYGIRFSDKVIFRKQYYVRALLNAPFTVFLHDNEEFATRGYVDNDQNIVSGSIENGWELPIGDASFKAKLHLAISSISE